MSETMQGKRVDWTSQILGPGEYAKLPDGTWYCATPNGHGGNLSAHSVTEHDDGTISVSPSILVTVQQSEGKPDKELWHGFLERGVWRNC